MQWLKFKSGEQLADIGRLLLALCLSVFASAGFADEDDLSGDGDLGAFVFSQNCSACHRLDGAGEERLYPSLHNPTLLADKQLLIRTVLDGRLGHQKKAGGKPQRLMPAWSFLSDKEVAAVIAFITESWGAQKIVVSEKEVAQARDAHNK